MKRMHYCYQQKLAICISKIQKDCIDIFLEFSILSRRGLMQVLDKEPIKQINNITLSELLNVLSEYMYFYTLLLIFDLSKIKRSILIQFSTSKGTETLKNICSFSIKDILYQLCMHEIASKVSNLVGLPNLSQPSSGQISNSWLVSGYSTPVNNN